MMMRLFTRCCALVFAISWPAQAYAIDLDGNYATRGAGNRSCAEFVAAYDEKSTGYVAFGGWIDGFLSAVNFFEERTFDIAPWQSTQLIAASLSRYCTNVPDLPFHTALSRLVVQLGPQRLATLSEMIIAETRAPGAEAGKVERIALYEATVERVQARLRALELYGEDVNTAALDAPTRAALERFQTRRKLNVTGLPDQATLLLLFDDRAATASAP